MLPLRKLEGKYSVSRFIILNLKLIFRCLEMFIKLSMSVEKGYFRNSVYLQLFIKLNLAPLLYSPRLHQLDKSLIECSFLLFLDL